MVLLRLFYEFFCTGLFAIGGGMATIPFLYDISDKTGWFTHADLTNMIAISESTPGPIGVNMATYVGYITGSSHSTLFAFLGSIVATLGLITPSVIVILLITTLLKGFKDNKYVKRAFYLLRPASCALIAAAAITVSISSLFIKSDNTLTLNYKALALALIIFILSNKVKLTKKLHPIVFILSSALIGIVFSF